MSSLARESSRAPPLPASTTDLGVKSVQPPRPSGDLKNLLILLAGALVFASVLGRIIFSVAGRSKFEPSNNRRPRREIWPTEAFEASGHRGHGFASPYIRTTVTRSLADARAAQISDEIEDLLMRVVRRPRR